jgi:hypothetical protein
MVGVVLDSCGVELCRWRKKGGERDDRTKCTVSLVSLLSRVIQSTVGVAFGTPSRGER